MSRCDRDVSCDVCGRCTDSVSRVAAYELLLELADGCVENMQEMCRDLVLMHHQAHTDSDHQWEVSHRRHRRRNRRRLTTGGSRWTYFGCSLVSF